MISLRTVSLLPCIIANDRVSIENQISGVLLFFVSHSNLLRVSCILVLGRKCIFLLFLHEANFLLCVLHPSNLYILFLIFLQDLFQLELLRAGKVQLSFKQDMVPLNNNAIFWFWYMQDQQTNAWLFWQIYSKLKQVNFVAQNVVLFLLSKW